MSEPYDACTLVDFPFEILNLITRQLNPTDLLALRKVCRQFNQITSHLIGDAFFETLNLDLSLYGLEKIKTLSENEQLRNRVRHLQIESSLEEAMIYIKDEDRRDFCKSLEDATREIIFKNRQDLLKYQMEKWSDGWVGLKKLQLFWSTRDIDTDWTSRLLLGASSHLQELTLHISGEANTAVRAAASRFLGWLSSTTETLPRLQNLCLSAVECSEDVLSRLVIRFKDSLLEISVGSIRIVGGGTWVSALTEWGDKLSLLRGFAISHCTEESSDQFGFARQEFERIHRTIVADVTTSERVTFPSLRNDRVVPGTGGRIFNIFYESNDVPIVSYEGPFADRGLKVLAAKIVLKSYCHTLY